ncbi:MAG: IS3 family transposase [Nitrospirota bacterium]|nr:IS3 family transposase [Nitrospirota bacterium]
MPRAHGLALRLLRLGKPARERPVGAQPRPALGHPGIHRESRETYGSSSIWDALIKRGHGVGEHRVARLMRQDGIRTKTVKQWRATTQSQHRFPVAANTLHRQFTVESPNRVWAGDLTDVWTTEGWLYLAVVLDLYSRLVIDWVMGHRLTGELAEQALTMALAGKPKPTARAPAPLGSRESVCCYALPASARRARYHHQYEPHRQLLGQRLCRKLLRDTHARARVPSALRDPCRRDTGHL